MLKIHCYNTADLTDGTFKFNNFYYKSIIDMNNFIIITTYIGSGVSDPHFIDQRINILKYSTIPSILSQTEKNFIWCIYLDELNTPKQKIDELTNLFESFKKHINIHICNHKPILSDGSLCVDNRARSCSSKRYELYIESINYSKKNGYISDNTKYITHLMLDDDDPILKDHIKWINEKVIQFNNKLIDNKAIIVINRNQYILYLDHMKLVNIESTKALKGSCFIFYPAENALNIKFHPYSIIETIENNGKYKEMYNISYETVMDPATWIYFRHKLSTSAYQKEFIINKNIKIIEGKESIVKQLEFYNAGKLDRLINSLKNENKSSELTLWRSTRDNEKKKLAIIVDDIKLYENALRFCIFLKHNFTINIITLDSRTSELIKEHSNFFEKNMQVSDLANYYYATIKLRPDYIFIFGKLDLELPLKRHKHCMLNDKNKTHKLFDTEIKNVLSWKRIDFMFIYNKLMHNLNQ